MGNMTPMMKQYLEMKKQYPGMILFFRLGDFYEMFFDDAKTVSKELDLTLTGKSCGLEERAPMCGVPFHSADTYINQLIEKGYKVAICEQMEDPATAKGLVKRDVIRIVTPGTLIEPSMLNERRNNYILSICRDTKKIGLAYADVSTGEFYTYEIDNDDSILNDEIMRTSPREVIANEELTIAQQQIKADTLNPNEFLYSRCKNLLFSHFHVQTLEAFDLEDLKQAVRASGALLHYLIETQKNQLAHITSIQRYVNGKYMILDQTSRRNLELTESIRTRSRKNTLLGVLDYTCTAMGARQLRAYIEQPLIKKNDIDRRLSMVKSFKENELTLDLVRTELEHVYDIERLLSHIAYRTITPKQCLALRDSLAHIQPIYDAIKALEQNESIQKLNKRLYPLTDIEELLKKAIDSDAPALMNDGRFIRDGYNNDLDAFRSASRDGRQWIADLELKERELTGIKNLRIQYNRVFGYYIEVTKSNYDQVPYRYTRKQTLANCERYTTEELHEIEEKVLGAQEKAVRLEHELFSEIRDTLVEHIPQIQVLASGIKELDAICSLTMAAIHNHYEEPEICEDGIIEIQNGRHPVVENSMQGDELFIPNDTLIDQDDNRMLIITGPNMAGKSTYMRQVALITLMAQVGSYVPADHAHIGVVDRIFTRIGASDDLAGGQSTFMVEMNEMAHILKKATVHSLIILDEIGRGTSTFDGLSIAWAVVEHLVDKESIGAKTLFATHYHELSELEGRLDGVVNYRISVKERGEDIVFLRKIEKGGTDKSFGIHVAYLAGMPQKVIMRAHEILARLETNDESHMNLGQGILDDGSNQKPKQVNLFESPAVELINEIKGLDVMAMTPIDALNALFTIKEKARRA